MKNFLLIGNANTGKTTLLNSLTKSDEHTGNWHGVTVEEKQKFFRHQGQVFSIVDLPGVYSLNALSIEEQVSINYIFNNDNKSALIINTCDINTLNKNLFLTLDLLSQNKNLVLAINTMGQKKYPKYDLKKIEEELKIKVFVFDFNNKKQIEDFKKNISENYEKYNKKNNINYCEKFLEDNILKILNEKSKKNNLKLFEIIKIIEKNNYYCKKYNNLKVDEIDCFLLSKNKYNYINNLLNYKVYNKTYGNEKIDRILLNKYLAIPIFIVILLSIFYVTFFGPGLWCSNLLSDLIQVKIGGVVTSWVENVCKIDWVIGLIKNGFFAGVGSLISFLPQVVLLFLFLAILEDTGYFSRIAFMFEDLFNSIGLSGKSVYTLLMGFGCSASAVLTAKAMDNKTAKIKTAILTPYMSCSAKLPIYSVLGGAFFGAGNVFIIFLLYLIGVFTAFVVSLLLEKIGLKSKETAFLIEFPPYRFPKFKRICKIAWQNLKIFLIKVTTIFISMSVIIWCLGNFNFAFEYVAFSDKKSILQYVGEFLAPIFEPIGFNNWGAVGALIAGIVAKEIIVSSLAIFNGVSIYGENANSQIGYSLTRTDSVVSFTASGAISYLTFCLLYCPCLATMAVMKKEIGFKWTMIAIILQLLFAYVMSFIVYNLFKLSEIIGLCSLTFLAFFSLVILLSIFRVVDYLKNRNKCKICGKCKF